MWGDIHLPSVLAVINIATIVVLAIGYVMIRRGNKSAHRAVMICAAVLGVAFMVVYLSYHLGAGLAKFGGQGLIRPIYFTLLTAHIITATVAAPLVPYTIYRGLAGHYDQHRRAARWAWPIWFFVATSGIIIYVMVMLIWPEKGP